MVQVLKICRKLCCSAFKLTSEHIIHFSQHFYWDVLDDPKLLLSVFFKAKFRQIDLGKNFTLELYFLGPNFKNHNPFFEHCFAMTLKPVNHFVLLTLTTAANHCLFVLAIVAHIVKMLSKESLLFKIAQNIPQSL